MRQKVPQPDRMIGFTGPDAIQGGITRLLALLPEDKAGKDHGYVTLNMCGELDPFDTTASIGLTSTEARELAAALVQFADRAGEACE